MAEDNETNATKKRRIIHWNPDAGREEVRRRWTWKRILGWSVGGFFGLLFAAGLVIRGIKLVLGPEIFQARAVVAAAEPTVSDANTAFISQAKAEQAFELTSKALRELRRVPTDHPSQLEHLIMMEKAFSQGETLVKAHEFGRAFAIFESLNQDIDAFSKNVKIKGEARQAYDAILLRIKDLELARSLAPGKLEAAFEAAGAGRQLLNDGNFTGAKKVFDEGFAELKKAEQALAAFGKSARGAALPGQRGEGSGQEGVSAGTGQGSGQRGRHQGAEARGEHRSGVRAAAAG
jgi:tetratricopeptide (TPR) repeat protein